MKARKRTLFFMIWAVLAMIGSILLWRFGARYTYQHPILIAENSQYTVVVDDNDRKTNVIRLDQNNHVTGRISYDRLEENAYHLASEVICGGDDWYLVENYNTIGSTDSRIGLYRLDFETQERVLLYEDLLPVLNETANAEEINAFPLDGRQFSLKDGAFYIQTGGTSFDGQTYYILLFRLENGVCSLEQTVQTPFYVKDVADLGGEWVVLPENSVGLYYGEQSLSLEDYSMLVTSDEGCVYGINQSSGVIQQVMEGDDTLQTNQMFLLNQLGQYGLDIRGIRSLDMVDESNFSAAYFDLGTPCLLMGRNGNLEIHSASATVSMPVLVLWCVLLTLSVGLVQLGVILAVRQIRRRGSVVVKILATLVPVMVLISACSTLLVAWLLQEYNIRQDQATMAAIGQEVHALGIHEDAALLEPLYTALESLDSPQEEAAYELYTKMYYDLARINENLAMQPNVLDLSSSQELSNQLRLSVEFYALDRETGIYYGVCTQADLRPFDYWMAPGQAELFREQIRQGGQELFEYYSAGDQKLSGIIYPARQENGEVNGFYLISADPIEGDNRISQIIRQFAVYQLILCILLLLLFTPIIFFSLRPLSVLRGKARQLTRGTFPDLDPPAGKLSNEIRELNETFRRLTAYVQDNMERMIRLQKLSRAYFSKQILQLLGKTSVSQLNFHESVTCPLYIAYLKPGLRTFSEIQTLVRQSVPMLESCDGFFGSVSDDEIVMVSKQSTLFYVAAAMAQERKDLRVAFDYTPVTVCIAGTEAEYRFLITPENENRKNTLCTYRDAFGCRLLAFAGAVPQGQKELNSRLVAQMDREMLVEFFLDAFSNPYRLGQQDLEQGVRLFFAGELDRARSSFVQALRYLPRDTVALYYIALIDAQGTQAQKGEYV